MFSQGYWGVDEGFFKNSGKVREVLIFVLFYSRGENRQVLPVYVPFRSAQLL